MSRSMMLSFDELAERIGEALESTRSVPLLVLRSPCDLPAPEAIAAVRAASARVVRAGDALASDGRFFAIAMLAPARAGAASGSATIRAALERITAALTLSTGAHGEAGWWLVESRAEVAAFSRLIESALERGRRERERHALLATIGHELRTPLTSIRGYIETLLDGDPLDVQTHRRFLETARQQTLRLGRLVDGMLEFSMLDLAMFERRASCNVLEPIASAVDAIRPLARERGMVVERVPADALPARVDADACEHALVNLLENAVKYGRERGRVLVTGRSEGGFVRITVDDDGPGIDAAQRQRIFNMGVRGATGDRPGRGIGLAVVRAIAQRSGGGVSAHVSPLGGSRFAIWFPALDEEAGARASTPC
jgi:signal transduction histidine kinase